MRKTIFRLALITIAVLLVAVAPAAAQTETVVRVDPAFLQVAPDAEFDLTIQIDDVVNLYAFDVRVSFPPLGPESAQGLAQELALESGPALAPERSPETGFPANGRRNCRAWTAAVAGTRSAITARTG